MPSVTGRRILITGSAAGLGRAIALRCGSKGAALVLWDIDAVGNEETARLVLAAGAASADAFTVNLAEPKAIEDAAAATGAVWCVVNNAGVVTGGGFLESSPERTELTFRVNVLSHMYMARQFLPAMIRANAGAFVSVTSVASYLAGPGMVDYASSKAAARTFIEVLAQEVVMAAPKVHLACACPGPMDTELFHGFGIEDPLVRVAKTTDVARGIVDDLIEAGQVLGFWPWETKLAIAWKGLVSERNFRRFMWPGLRKLMDKHRAERADAIFEKMETTAKL